MVRFPNVKVDPWFNDQEKYSHYERIPEDAVFACAYIVFMNPFDLGESTFFRRVNGVDALWVASWNAEFNKNYVEIEHGKQELFKDFGCAVSAPSTETIQTACQILLTHLFRARVNFNFPSNFVREGIVSEVEFNNNVQFLKDELDGYAKNAEALVSEVVKTAEELGLNPRPDGRSFTVG